MQHGSKEIVISEFIVRSIAGNPFGRAVMATLEEKGGVLSPFAAGRAARKPRRLAGTDGSAPGLAGHDIGAGIGDGPGGVIEMIEE
jgi:hypothetical protein